MALHYLNADDEERECPGCFDCRDGEIGYEAAEHCSGSGRLGKPGARPDVVVHYAYAGGPLDFGGAPMRTLGAGWYWWMREPDGIGARGPFLTEASALDDARAAQKEGR